MKAALMLFEKTRRPGHGHKWLSWRRRTPEMLEMGRECLTCGVYEYRMEQIRKFLRP